MISSGLVHDLVLEIDIGYGRTKIFVGSYFSIPLPRLVRWTDLCLPSAGLFLQKAEMDDRKKLYVDCHEKA